ncbi:MAG TPA: LysM domain-containing protein [Phycisphaerae bacterium]|nr:LysM domain-containing protein [Phycisphaerae bacterium]
MAEVTPAAAAPAAAAGRPDTEPETLVLDDVRASDPWASAGTPLMGAAQVNRAASSDPSDPPGQTRTPAEWESQASLLFDEGRIPEARSALNAALLLTGPGPHAASLRQQLAVLNGGVFLGSAIVPEDPAAPFLEIQPGDSFLKLSRRYAVPAALLEAVNPNLNPRDLRPGVGVKVVRGPFHLRYAKSEHRLDLFARELYVRSFPGQVEEGDYLPLGTYRMRAASKIEVGGKLWIGFEGAAPDTQEITVGWIYGTAGPRLGRNRGLPAGIKVGDADLRQLYNVLVESRSLMRVDP